MQRVEAHPLDDTSTPLLVCGALSGLAGGAAAMIPTALFSWVRGHGATTPAKLVAATLMGRDALDRDNGLAATMIGVLITLVAAAGAGALFTWLRRRESRVRLLVLEGIGFAWVLLGGLWIALPHVNPLMYAAASWPAMVLSFAVFGAVLALELLLRVGTFDQDEIRRGLGDGA